MKVEVEINLFQVISEMKQHEIYKLMLDTILANLTKEQQYLLVQEILEANDGN